MGREAEKQDSVESLRMDRKILALAGAITKVAAMTMEPWAVASRQQPLSTMRPCMSHSQKKFTLCLAWMNNLLIASASYLWSSVVMLGNKHVHNMTT